MPFFSQPLKLKLSELREAMMDLKPSSELSSPVETKHNQPLKNLEEIANATNAHALKLRKNIVDTTPLMLLEKLSRKPPRTSKEKLRREKTKRKPKTPRIKPPPT